MKRHPDVLLAAALARDLDGTFERFVLTYQDRIFRFATRFAGGPQDGQEIAQDAFVRAFRALKGYDAARIASLALGPWLYRITLNTARNRVRGKRFTLSALEDAAEPLADPGEQPEARAVAQSSMRAVRALILDLPLRYRAAVVLRYIEDLPYNEIATVLDAPLGTVKANVHRGLAVLRTRLAAQGETRV